MKKILIAGLLLGSMTGVAFASLSSNKKKAAAEKKAEKKERKCSHTCPYSQSI